MAAKDFAQFKLRGEKSFGAGAPVESKAGDFGKGKNALKPVAKVFWRRAQHHTRRWAWGRVRKAGPGAESRVWSSRSVLDSACLVRPAWSATLVGIPLVGPDTVCFYRPTIVRESKIAKSTQKNNPHLVCRELCFQEALLGKTEADKIELQFLLINCS